MMKQGGGINLRISKGKHRRSYCIPRWKERKELRMGRTRFSGFCPYLHYTGGFRYVPGVDLTILFQGAREIISVNSTL